MPTNKGTATKVHAKEVDNKTKRRLRLEISYNARNLPVMFTPQIRTPDQLPCMLTKPHTVILIERILYTMHNDMCARQWIRMFKGKMTPVNIYNIDEK